MKMIFLNIGWMKSYKGLTNDKIKGGGSFVGEHGYGYEIHNFDPLFNKMYGYVQPVSSYINIDRLGAPKQDGSVDHVLVVWVSKSSSRGRFIVGWYKDATVYRNQQKPPQIRKHRGEDIDYFIVADEDDCKLLPIDERIFKIPTGKGGMGRSNVWFADKEKNRNLRHNVWDYINNNKIQKDEIPKSKNGKPWQPDPLKRQQVEKNAIYVVANYYKELGYSVDSVESDNVGWDLEATINDITLNLEVKGLSQENVLFGLTPNEYEKMNENIDSYRICVVTKALCDNPILKIFIYSPESRTWEDNLGNKLQINEITSAIMSI